jgi:hypothetical protein
MLESPASLVQGLQGALMQTRFGAMLCVGPQFASPAAAFSFNTLNQVAMEVGKVNQVLGTRLTRAVSLAEQKKREPNALRDAWVAFTAIVNGNAVVERVAGEPAEAVADTANPVTSARSMLALADGSEERSVWIGEYLDRMKVPEVLKTSALEWLARQGAIGLEFENVEGKYFKTTVVGRRSGPFTISISIPSKKSVVTDDELCLLIARAIAVKSVAMRMGGARLDVMGKVYVGHTDRPVGIFSELELLYRLQAVLSQKRFQKYRRLLPIEKGFEAAYRPKTLADIAAAVAADDVNLGTRLATTARRAEMVTDGQREKLAWTSFIIALNAAGDGAGAALVDMDAFLSASEKLEAANPGRRRWLAEALREMGVPSPDSFLDSIPIDKREAICVDFVEGKNGKFSVSSDCYTSRTYVNVTIAVPRGMKIKSEDEIRYLVARALVISSSKVFLPESVYDEHRSVAPGALKEPIRLAVFDSGAVVVLGPVGANMGKLQELADEHIWLWAATDAMNSMHFERSATAQRTLTEVKRRHRPVSAERTERRYSNTWRNFLQVPRIEGVFLRPTSFVRLPEHSLIFEVDESMRSDIGFSLKEHMGGLAVVVSLSSKTMKELERKDITELIVRASSIRSARTELARRSMSIISAEAFFERRGLSPELRLGRALMLLASRLKDRTETASEDIDVEGDIPTLAAERFATVLDAVSIYHSATDVDVLRAAWSEVLAIKRWYLSDRSSPEDGGVVDVIPVGGMGLVNVHGDSSSMDPRQWLFVLSALAANPGHATRINVAGKRFVDGAVGDTNEIYGSIAANAVFDQFGLFDPAAKLPELAEFRFPGGEAPSRNSHYATAEPEVVQKYIAALRWFATAAIPDEWKPVASDDKAAVKKKYRAMSFAWHPDRKPTAVQENLQKNSNSYWSAVLAIYEKK